MSLSSSSLRSSKNGLFQYVLIPADNSLPIQQLESSKEGGLSDDYLSKEAKKYFFEKSGGAERASMLDNATPEEKKALVQKIRNDYANSAQKSAVDKLDDDALLNILRYVIFFYFYRIFFKLSVRIIHTNSHKFFTYNPTTVR